MHDVTVTPLATPALHAIIVNGAIPEAHAAFVHHRKNLNSRSTNHLLKYRANAGPRQKKGQDVPDLHVLTAIAGNMEDRSSE